MWTSYFDGKTDLERGRRMEDWLARQKLLIGERACQKLQQSKVAVIGLGGVGGACVEALCRCGVGTLVLVDHDTVEMTNLNRQLIATQSTMGQSKTEACKKRVLDINPDCNVIPLNLFYGADNWEQVFCYKPDYVIDCIDTVTAKLHLAVTCREQHIPLLTCLGTGNRLDPSCFRIGDIGETAKSGGGCGLARVMRRELKKRGIIEQQVLYSTEAAVKTVVAGDETGRYAPGSISFCPPVAGYMLAGKAVRDLIESETNICVD